MKLIYPQTVEGPSFKAYNANQFLAYEIKQYPGCLPLRKSIVGTDIMGDEMSFAFYTCPSSMSEEKFSNEVQRVFNEMLQWLQGKDTYGSYHFANSPIGKLTEGPRDDI